MAAPKRFLRKDAVKHPKVGKKWHAPKGVHNKMRESRKGRSPKVRPGYGTRDSDRGKHLKTGLAIIRVDTVAELHKLDPRKQGAVLASVGKRKKLELIAEAKKKGITIINFNADKYAKRAEDARKQKETESKKKEEKKEKREKEEKKKEPKAEEKKTEAKETAELSEEEKKKQEKEERDRVLTKGK